MSVEYNPLEAAKIAHQQLPPALRQLLTLEDVLYILYLEFQFYQSNAVAVSQTELLVAYIADAALQTGRSYTSEHIAYVLQGEDVYLRMIGLSEP